MKIGFSIRKTQFSQTDTTEEKLQKFENIIKDATSSINENETWYVEFTPEIFPDLFINEYNCNYKLADKIKAIVTKYNLKLLVHAPFSCDKGINLCGLDKTKREKSIKQAKAVIDLSKYLDVESITFHPGWIFAPDTKEEEKSEIRKNFDYYASIGTEHLIKSLKELTSYARDKNITINLENMEAREDIGYILMDPSNLSYIMETVAQPNLRITYDTGHSNLSANYLGFDQLKIFRELTSYIKEIHIHDNFGKPSLDGIKDYERGIGDIHNVPLVGAGTVPNKDFLKQINKETIILYELDKFKEDFRKSLGELRDLMYH